MATPPEAISNGILCTKPGNEMAPLRQHTGYFHARSVIMAICSTLALYNVLDLIILSFTTFKRWPSLHFWSLLVAIFGTIPYTVSFHIAFQFMQQYVGFAINSYD
jgi:hypothetical protein